MTDKNIVDDASMWFALVEKLGFIKNEFNWEYRVLPTFGEERFKIEYRSTYNPNYIATARLIYHMTLNPEPPHWLISPYANDPSGVCKIDVFDTEKFIKVIDFILITRGSVVGKTLREVSEANLKDKG